MTITERIRSIGVDLTWTDALPPQRLGAYLDDERRILIRSGLTTPLEQETLHHEFIHAWHRDRTSHPAVEWRAWREAAAMIIRPIEYAAAERISTSSAYIAHELGTTVRIVESYRRALARGELLAKAA